MKKQLSLMIISLALATSSFASNPLIPKRFQQKKQSLMTISNPPQPHQAYVNLSGHWVGSCNGDDEKVSVTIEQNSDYSSITIDHLETPID